MVGGVRARLSQGCTARKARPGGAALPLLSLTWMWRWITEAPLRPATPSLVAGATMSPTMTCESVVCRYWIRLPSAIWTVIVPLSAVACLHDDPVGSRLEVKRLGRLALLDAGRQVHALVDAGDLAGLQRVVLPDRERVSVGLLLEDAVVVVRFGEPDDERLGRSGAALGNP
jgi:hypothetical protein